MDELEKLEEIHQIKTLEKINQRVKSKTILGFGDVVLSGKPGYSPGKVDTLGRTPKQKDSGLSVSKARIKRNVDRKLKHFRRTNY